MQNVPYFSHPAESWNFELGKLGFIVGRSNRTGWPISLSKGRAHQAIFFGMVFAQWIGQARGHYNNGEITYRLGALLTPQNFFWAFSISTIG